MNTEQEGRLFEKMDWLIRLTERIDLTINGDANNEGIKSQVLRHDRAIIGAYKFIWIVVSAVVGLGAAVLFS